MLNAAQELLASLYGESQQRDFKAAHALRGTPPKRHDNIIAGRTRGERKRILRQCAAMAISRGQTVEQFMRAHLDPEWAA